MAPRGVRGSGNGSDGAAPGWKTVPGGGHGLRCRKFKGVHDLRRWRGKAKSVRGLRLENSAPVA